HLEQATEEDADQLARAGTVGVFMTGASMTTAAPYAPARMVIEHGVRVALSSDFNPGTSYSENLQLKVALGCGLLRMTVEEALQGLAAGGCPADAHEQFGPRGRRASRRPCRLRRHRPRSAQLGTLRLHRLLAPLARVRRDAPRPVRQAGRGLPHPLAGAPGA